MHLSHLKNNDPEVYTIIVNELKRQQEHIELIASENFTSMSVMEAASSVMTNKYAEGTPGKRYYCGCEYMDDVEQLAIDRLKKLFGAEHANVQPHSGAQANMAVMLSALKPGDTVLGMDLSNGGHLTHGSPVNFSGLYFNVVPYGIDLTTGYIDYDHLRKLALTHKPKLIICGASSYPRVIHFDQFKSIADEVGAYLMADIAHIAGLIVADLHPSPIGYADFITSTTHKTLRGPRGGVIMCRQEYSKLIDKAVFPGIQGGPLMHIIAAKAVAFKEALDPSFKTYAQAVVNNSKALAEGLLMEGLNLVSGGTDNHMLTLDLQSLNLTGKLGSYQLEEINITTNKNTVPNDPQSPFVTSGIRLGSPAVTTRGFIQEDMLTIAAIIGQRLKHQDMTEQEVSHLKYNVLELCGKRPLYPELSYDHMSVMEY